MDKLSEGGLEYVGIGMLWTEKPSCFLPESIS